MSKNPSSAPPSPAAHPDRLPPRRSFLQEALAVVIGGVVGLVPLLSGVLFFLDPLRRGRQAPTEQKPARDEKGYIRVTTLDNLPVNGEPRKFPVIAEIIDAWNYIPNQPIGNVILRKSVEGAVTSADQLLAFSDVCPHLQCPVDFKPADNAFLCPCHASAFSLDGARNNHIPPRDLDRLDVELRGNEIWVKYLRFKPSTPEKIVV